MKKTITILTLMSLSNAALANPLEQLANSIEAAAFTPEQLCQRKLKREIKAFEKGNPRDLFDLVEMKGELYRLKKMNQLKELALQQVKAIEKENDGNLTLDSFFSSDKPLSERMTKKEDHPIVPSWVDDVIDEKEVEVEYKVDNPFTGEVVHTEKLKTESRTWYDWQGSSDKKLVLNIEFDKPKINCSYKEVQWPVKLYSNWDDAKRAYDYDQRMLAAESEMLGYEVTLEDSEESDYSVEGEVYHRIDGKIYTKDCDRHNQAPSGVVSIEVTKDKDGKYKYKTKIAETDLVDPWNNNQEFADRADLLARIGFVERLEGQEEGIEHRFPNGTPISLIKNEGALSEYVKKAEKVYSDHFEKRVGKSCFDQFLAGNIQIPEGFNESVEDRIRYNIVQGLNRSTAQDSKIQQSIADGGAKLSDQTSVGSN